MTCLEHESETEKKTSQFDNFIHDVVRFMVQEELAEYQTVNGIISHTSYHISYRPDHQYDSSTVNFPLSASPSVTALLSLTMIS